MNEHASRGGDLLQNRIDESDTELAAFAENWQQRAPDPLLQVLDADSVAVTGAGGSEGPARYLAAQLSGQVRFVPLSAFANENTVPIADALVLFSQGLSPNARLALRHLNHFKRTALLTSRPRDSSPRCELEHETASNPNVSWIQLPPEQEEGLLVRIVGTAIATWAAIRASGGGKDVTPQAVTQLRREARGRCRELLEGAAAQRTDEPIAFLSAATSRELYHGQTWKLLEGLGLPLPPVWDVLQIAHGPFQQFYDRRILLCALTVQGECSQLWDRLAAMMVPSRHHVLRLEASNQGAVAWLEHDAMINELLCAFYRHHPRDLVQWSGKGCDGPLYRLGE